MDNLNLRIAPTYFMKSTVSSLSLWLVLFVIFLDWIGIGLVYPMFSSMLFHPEPILLPPETSTSTRGIYLGLLLAAMPMAQFFSGPVLGALSDSKGRKPLFLFSLSLALVGYFLSMSAVWAHSVALLIFSRLVVGIAAGNAAVVSATIADLSHAQNKTKNFGLYGSACGLGFTLGPFLGGQFSEISFALPFLVALLLTLANLVALYFLLPETNLHRKETPFRVSDGLTNIKKAFQMAELRALFLSVLFLCLGWSFFYEFIPVVWISTYHMPSSGIGILYAYGALFFALSSSFLIQPVVSRFRQHEILFYGLSLLGGTILTLLFQPSLGWIWVYLPLVNFFIALLEPTATSMVSNWAHQDSQGEVLGIFQSIQSLAWIVSPLLAGPLLGFHLSFPMLLGGVAILISALLLGNRFRTEIFYSREKK